MASQQDTSSLFVMTYNIRFDTIKDGRNQWSFRKNRVIQLIQHYSPDLLSVQEPLPRQIVDLKTELSNYQCYGVGRNDGKENGEFCAVFYRRDRFELINKGTFWLSEKPHQPGSKGWDAALPRICSWAELKDKCAKKEIFYFNTHFDHEGQKARRESARLILSRIKELAGSSTPVILTGDFNSGPETDAYHTIVNDIDFNDAKIVAESPHSGPEGTWSTFDKKAGIGERIDYIFITSSHFKVLRHEHLTDSDDRSYPSDHLPVLAQLDYKYL